MKKITFFLAALCCTATLMANTPISDTIRYTPAGADYTLYFRVMSSNTVQAVDSANYGKYPVTPHGDLVIPSVVKDKDDDEYTVVKIGGYAFADCSEITSVTFPNTIESIGSQAFTGCSFASITLPESLKSLVGSAFRYNPNLQTIHIPSQCDASVLNPFQEWPGLKTITVAEDNPYYVAIDGVLYNKDTTQIICFPRKKEAAGSEYVIPSTVTEVCYYAFNAVESITKIVLPENVTKLAYASLTLGRPNAQLIFKGQVPPYKVDDTAIGGVSSYKNTCKVIVPCGKAEAYQTAFTNFGLAAEQYEEQLLATINIVAENGTVALSDTTDCNQVKLTATPASGYKFSQWSDGVTDNPRIVVVNSDTTFTAQFVVDSPTALEQVELGNIEVRDGRVYCENDFRIYDTLGRDVTRMNGNLHGVYVVRCGEKATKVVVK